MTEPLVPRYREMPPRPPAAQDLLADAALRNLRQVALVLLGLAALFVAGWAGLLLAGARPVGWGQLLMVITVVAAAGMLVEGLRRLHVWRVARVLLATGGPWQHVDAHWIGRRGVRGRRLMVLSEDGAACLWVRDAGRAAERAVDARGRVWIRPTAKDGRSAVMVDPTPEILLARVNQPA